jgi:hypothetical protein
MCKTGFARRALTGNGMRCARRGIGRFVQTTENPAGSPGAARGRVLLCKLIVKTCPQITVNWPVSASSILDDAATPFFCKPQIRRGLASAQHAAPTPASTAPSRARGDKNSKRCYKGLRAKVIAQAEMLSASLSGGTNGRSGWKGVIPDLPGL